MRPFAKPLWIFVLVFVENLPTMAAIIYAVITSDCLFQCRINANRGPWQLFSRTPYLRETKTYHSQPLESTRRAGNYFVPISIRPIFIFLLQKLCQITPLLTG